MKAKLFPIILMFNIIVHLFSFYHFDKKRIRQRVFRFGNGNFKVFNPTFIFVIFIFLSFGYGDIDKMADNINKNSCDGYGCTQDRSAINNINNNSNNDSNNTDSKCCMMNKNKMPFSQKLFLSPGIMLVFQNHLLRFSKHFLQNHSRLKSVHRLQSGFLVCGLLSPQPIRRLILSIHHPPGLVFGPYPILAQ